MELSVHQTGELYEIAELHEMWYKQFYQESPSFELLLELNHCKLITAIGDDGAPADDIDSQLTRMKSNLIDIIEYNEN